MYMRGGPSGIRHNAGVHRGEHAPPKMSYSRKIVVGTRDDVDLDQLFPLNVNHPKNILPEHQSHPMTHRPVLSRSLQDLRMFNITRGS